MNNRTKTIYNTSIYSPEWAEIDDYNHRRLYAILGFRTLGDFLGMRMYDFLNMNQNDSGYAGNTILDLYNFVNPNNKIDEAIYYDAIEQPINTRRGGCVDTDTVGTQKYVSELTRVKPARFANPNLIVCSFNFWFRYMQNSII